MTLNILPPIFSAPIELEYGSAASVWHSGGAASHTFTGQSFGTPKSGRKVLAFIYGMPSSWSPFPTVSIGGISASRIWVGSPPYNFSSMWMTDNELDSSGSLAIVAPIEDVWAEIYSIHNLAVAATSQVSSPADVASGGALLGLGSLSTGTSVLPQTPTWSGLDEDHNGSFVSGTVRRTNFTSAHRNFLNGATSHSVSVAYSPSSLLQLFSFSN